jgi:alpha-amylase/alpha-mannosidase (GH57 family)
MAAPRYICIHGHFYQPPRENPWLEAVEVQDSAAPDHDWNERITRQCYGPNARSRLVDGQGRIINLKNNYAAMSFNFGPTLLAWMEEHAPDVQAGIVAADRESRERRHGHGNALAQVYNHIIMPLAGKRDQQTQVTWGLADFRRRFGREAEGMWLAETAADTASLEALAAAGLRFTVLAPRQARRWRKIGETAWTETPGGIDPSRAYVRKLPSGKSIALFFYDGNISQQVAFERLLDSGEKFLARLMSGFDDRRTHAQLMHIATDGESYGHHHAFGDMALAYVLDRLAADPNIRLTNYGEFLELHPPEWEVEIHEDSSWSCAHGVERWRSDCGCRTRGDWHQRWRQPLRESFNWLKGELDALFAREGGKLFRDPWAAREGYIQVILDRSRDNIRAFFQQHLRNGVSDEAIRNGLWLLECQRHGLLMFTSCGWFFDEMSGLETTQCLRYAARAVQLARHFGAELEDALVGRLEAAPSNLPQYRNGRFVWQQCVQPTRIDLPRVLSHQAMSSIYLAEERREHVYAYELETLDQEVRERGQTHVAVGRLRVHSRLTWNEAETSFVVLHYGGLDFHTVLRAADSAEAYAAFKKRLLDTYRAGSLADVTALVAREFEGEVHRLDDLFAEEQRRIVGIVMQDRFEDYERVFRRLAMQDDDVLTRLVRLQVPVPKPLEAVASAYLALELRREIGHVAMGNDLDRFRSLCDRAKAWGYRPDQQQLAKTVAAGLEEALSPLRQEAPLVPAEAAPVSVTVSPAPAPAVLSPAPTAQPPVQPPAAVPATAATQLTVVAPVAPRAVAGVTDVSEPEGVTEVSPTAAEGELAQIVERVGRLLEAAELLELPLDLWRAQNLLLDGYVRQDPQSSRPAAREQFARLAEMLRIDPALLGWRP